VRNFEEGLINRASMNRSHAPKPKPQRNPHALPLPDGAEVARIAGLHPDAQALQIPDVGRLALAADACRAFPGECCGFLLGTEIDDVRVISEVIPINNAAPEGELRRFSIPPLDYMKAERYAEKSGVTILGIYHSHPEHAAVPSIYDLNLALPFFSYLILAVRNSQTPHVDHMRSWQLNSAGIFQEENIT
jgi:proteasome lid subunit RPN8/RPN11